MRIRIRIRLSSLKPTVKRREWFVRAVLNVDPESDALDRFHCLPHAKYHVLHPTEPSLLEEDTVFKLSPRKPAVQCRVVVSVDT
jgi:hypothetical protein